MSNQTAQLSKDGKPSTFHQELTTLINKHSQENYSNTPDFILSAYIADCLNAFNTAVVARERWYSRDNDDELAAIQQQAEQEQYEAEQEALYQQNQYEAEQAAAGQAAADQAAHEAGQY